MFFRVCMRLVPSSCWSLMANSSTCWPMARRITSLRGSGGLKMTPCDSGQQGYGCTAVSSAIERGEAVACGAGVDQGEERVAGGESRRRAEGQGRRDDGAD